MQLPSSASFEPSLVPIMRKVGASSATSCGPPRLPPSWLTSGSTSILLLPGSDQRWAVLDGGKGRLLVFDYLSRALWGALVKEAFKGKFDRFAIIA